MATKKRWLSISPDLPPIELDDDGRPLFDVKPQPPNDIPPWQRPEVARVLPALIGGETPQPSTYFDWEQQAIVNPLKAQILRNPPPFAPPGEFQQPFLEEAYQEARRKPLTPETLDPVGNFILSALLAPSTYLGPSELASAGRLTEAGVSAALKVGRRAAPVAEQAGRVGRELAVGEAGFARVPKKPKAAQPIPEGVVPERPPIGEMPQLIKEQPDIYVLYDNGQPVGHIRLERTGRDKAGATLRWVDAQGQRNEIGFIGATEESIQQLSPKEYLAKMREYEARMASGIPPEQVPTEPPRPPGEPPTPREPPGGGGAGTPGQPPGGEPPFGAIPPPQDPAAKLTELVKAAKPIRRETETLRTGERAMRAAIGQKAFEGAEGREAFYKAKGALAGELPKAQFEPPGVGLTAEDITGLFEQVKAKEKDYWKRISTDEALDTLLGGQLPTRSQIEALEEIFGPELAKAILSQRSWGQKAWEIFVDALNVPRTLQSAYDASAPLRQGAILFAGHPVKGAKAFAPMFKAAFSEKTALAIDTAIRRSKWADVREASGLYLAPLRGVSGKLGGREEAFMSRLASKVPGVRVSERAYNTYLNKIRADVFDGVVARWEQLGIKASEKDYSDLAKGINLMSGRGEIPRNLQGLAPVLNGLFFSPRLQMSRFELPFHLVRSSPLARKEMARNIVAFVGANATLGGLLAASQLATVELDPRSADFGKAKIGNTRIDLWAGYQQYARLVATLATGERKSAKGNIYSVPRGELFMRGVQSKFSPIAGLVTDVLRGQTYMGDELKMEPATIIDQAYNRLAPLFAQDLIDAIREAGLVGGFLAAPGLFGAGVQTYGPSELEKLQQKVSGGQWENLTPAERQAKERQSPELRALAEETYAKEAGAGQDYGERKVQQRQYETQRDNALIGAAKALKAGTIRGEQFRDVMKDALSTYANQTDGLWGTFRNATKQDANELALSQYMAIEPKRDPNTQELLFDTYDSERAALLTSLPREQQDYIKRNEAAWPNKFPPEVAPYMRMWQKDKELLKTYWGVTDDMWGKVPELKQLSDMIAQQPDQRVREQVRSRYPQLRQVEKAIEQTRDRMRAQNPALEKAILRWTNTTTPIQYKLRAG